MVGIKQMAARIVILVLALGFMVGLDAAPAQAKTMFASLHIDKNPQPGGKYLVNVDVWLPMNAYDAYGYYVNGARIRTQFYADDSMFDALLTPFANATAAVQTWYANSPGYTAESDGIHLRFQLLVAGRILDEDTYSLIFGDLRDEIYFKVLFTDGDGFTDLVTSNVATGYFCCG